MRTVHTVISFFLLIVDHIELGSQSGGERNVDWLDTPRPNRRQPPFSSSHRISRTLAVPEPTSRVRSRSPSGRTLEPPQSGSSRFLPARPLLARNSEYQVLGYELGQLGRIRLIPNRNWHRRFEFRRYTFRTDLPLRIRLGPHVYGRISDLEQIVLSSNGDVFAILETDGTLSGLYSAGSKMRSKINIGSNRITELTREEVEEVPIGSRRPMSLNFRELAVNYDSLNS